MTPFPRRHGFGPEDTAPMAAFVGDELGLGGGRGGGSPSAAPEPSSPPAPAAPPGEPGSASDVGGAGAPPLPSVAGDARAVTVVVAAARAALTAAADDGPLAVLVERGLVDVRPVPVDALGVAVDFRAGAAEAPTGHPTVDAHLGGSAPEWTEQVTEWVATVTHATDLADGALALEQGLVTPAVQAALAELARQAVDRQLVDVLVAALPADALPEPIRLVRPDDGTAPSLDDARGTADVHRPAVLRGPAVLIVRAGVPGDWDAVWEERHPGLAVVRSTAPSAALDALLADLTLVTSAHGAVAVHRASDLTPTARVVGSGADRAVALEIAERRAVPRTDAVGVTVTRMVLDPPG